MIAVRSATAVEGTVKDQVPVAAVMVGGAVFAGHERGAIGSAEVARTDGDL
ncbi:hypothetical protein ACCS54_26930 [Rhizobium johnstonii]|uniref:hypothetical protein n=1 Tax=Rhizobium johnstonii TaxID=3019933 RepID=UPI003F9E8EB7